MINKLIDRYKQIRKAKFLTKSYEGKYAFVGIGNHSINNLYPVLNYLNVDLKTIVSSSEKTAQLVSKNFEHIRGSHDYQAVLDDPEITGIFICANPKAHFSLIKQALKKDKNVFVEKPPCLNSDELNELIDVERQSKGFVLAGLQKRYAPLYEILKTKTKKAQTYSLKYQTGYYPEGDALTDLFIHPVDLANYLFGESEITSVQHFRKGNGIDSLFLHMKHKNEIIGNLELSTNVWWAKAGESIDLTCSNAHYHGQNTDLLTEMNKAGQMAGIPLEKIRKTSITTKILYEKNSFLPDMEHNELFSAGYYNEIKHFLDLCEGKRSKNLSPLTDLVNTFKNLDSVKSRIHV